MVGLPSDCGDRFPHEFSGGQRQRIAIARALAPRPDLIILDEPTSALDVSVKAQIVNLLADVQQRTGVAYLLISHDLAVVFQLSTAVGVMYLGAIVETGESRLLYERPRHPYTVGLLEASLSTSRFDPTTTTAIEGEVPSAAEIPEGCRFRSRCPMATDRCRILEPDLRLVDDRLVACHFAEDVSRALAS